MATSGIGRLWKPVVNVTDLDDGERFWSLLTGLTATGRHGDDEIPERPRSESGGSEDGGSEDGSTIVSRYEAGLVSQSVADPRFVADRLHASPWLGDEC